MSDFTAQRMTNDYVKIYQQLIADAAALGETEAAACFEL